jgi:hypothetical protein
VRPVGQQVQMIRHETVSLDIKTVRVRFLCQESQRFGHQLAVPKPWNTVQCAGREEVPLGSDVAGAGQPNVLAPEIHRQGIIPFL